MKKLILALSLISPSAYAQGPGLQQSFIYSQWQYVCYPQAASWSGGCLSVPSVYPPDYFTFYNYPGYWPMFVPPTQLDYRD